MADDKVAAQPTVDDKKAEDAARARQVGWTEPTAFDYDSFTRAIDLNNDALWKGSAKVYEWKDDFGEVAPPVPELEKLLFSGEYAMRRGKQYQNLEIRVNVEGPVQIPRIAKFEDAGLHPVVLDNIRLCQYESPTVIQAYTIPAVLAGYDVVAISQTGSGKTAAYLIPILSKLMGKAKLLRGPRPTANRFVKAEPLVVIVVPTRELAIQIFDEARRMCYRSMLRPCVAYGGMPMALTLNELGKGCDILIATPGRLCDLMDRPLTLTMARIKYTVIDEADEMLHSDWEEELTKIMSGGDTNEDADHVFMMFSATFPKAERELARRYLSNDHVRIRVGRAGSTHKNIRQEVMEVDRAQKQQAVYDYLMAVETPCRTLIFCNSKQTVEHLDDFLYNKGLPSTSIHAGRNQLEREDALRAFRTGKAPIMVSTGVSGRGWDIMGIEIVVNFDLPSTQYGGIQEYVHRIGRTARIGNTGLALSFYDPERDEGIAPELVKILIESDCEVPDFLKQYQPEDDKLEFDDDTDNEAGNAEDAASGQAEEPPSSIDQGFAATDSAWAPSEQPTTFW